MEITVPAKVNLYLNVIRKMDDGYHEIETLFEKISLADTISISPSREGTTISCDDESIPTDEGSLLGQTVKLFSEKAECAPVNIFLTKRIPVAAGLGGGSSDAASLLKGLNSLNRENLSNKELIEIGKRLGADVPFFLQEASFALGRQRGDEIEPVASSIKLWHVLVNPPFEVSTKYVYNSINPSDLTKREPVDRMMSTFLSEGDVLSLAKNLHNDLQPIVLRKFSDIHNVLTELNNTGPQGVLLSGSGPTVFGVFAEEEEARSAEQKLKEIFPQDKGWGIFVAETF